MQKNIEDMLEDMLEDIAEDMKVFHIPFDTRRTSPRTRACAVTYEIII